jgi:Bacterial regulatory proteins, tetR family.
MAMFDDFSKRTKAIRAALELAQERRWSDISLAEIAGAAGLSLADLRREFTSKSGILRAFQAGVDAETLAKARGAAPEQSPRDRLFDIIMTRFELMAPYKPALARIHADLGCHPGEAAPLFCSTLISQYWMLAGAGAKLEGVGACIRVTGLGAIYAKVFRVWLDDASPGLDSTMAALDRKLRKGERLVACLEQAHENLCRFACGLVPRGWGGRRDGEAATQSPPPAGGAAPAPTG